jgi:general secretion pathway protein K
MSVRRRWSSERRGVALVLTLWLIVIAGGIAAAVAAGTRTASSLAGNARARVAGRYAAESGVELAVAALEQRLDALADSSARRAYLNRLDDAVTQDSVVLGDQRFHVVLVDVNARLDVNAATEEQLGGLLATFGSAIDATTAARLVRAHIDDVQPGEAARVFRSLDELARLPGVSPALVRSAAPYLTVDGDGHVNRATASDTVRRVAGGSLVDEPSRILVVSRGWFAGHPLTHEIQAVYAVNGNRLALVRWRERDL